MIAMCTAQAPGKRRMRIVDPTRSSVVLCVGRCFIAMFSEWNGGVEWRRCSVQEGQEDCGMRREQEQLESICKVEKLYSVSLN